MQAFYHRHTRNRSDTPHVFYAFFRQATAVEQLGFAFSGASDDSANPLLTTASRQRCHLGLSYPCPRAALGRSIVGIRFSA